MPKATKPKKPRNQEAINNIKNKDYKPTSSNNDKNY